MEAVCVALRRAISAPPHRFWSGKCCIAGVCITARDLPYTSSSSPADGGLPSLSEDAAPGLQTHTS